MSIRCALRAQGAAVTHWQRRCAPALVALALGAPALGQPNEVGQWDPPPGGLAWPYNVINAIHLHAGDILVWDVHGPPDFNDPKLWNPADGSFTDVPSDSDLFCAGHAGLTDGSVLIAGGGAGGFGSMETTIYDPAASPPWNVVASMNYKRWYPTCTTLPNGKILAVAGKDGLGVHVEIPEIYDPAEDEWVEMTETSAEKKLRTYPYMFVVPDIDPLVYKVFFAGPNTGPTDLRTWTLDVNAQSWDFVDDSPFNGVEGSAVMYEPGKVLKAGGGATNDEAGDEAATIDLNDPTPMWIPQNSMAAARHEFILVLLADGTVLAVGGEDSGAYLTTPELYDPETGFWSNMDVMQKKRGHHSVALLLASGKVLSAGGDGGNPDGETAEIFSPPYLFDALGEAPRPKIGFAPTAVLYGTSFSVILSRASPVPRNEIEKVTFVRLGAVTHRFDQNQRYLSLAVQTDPAQEFGLIVEAPVNGTFAPPGYYMLFLVSDTGVPSIAKYIQLIPPPVT